LNKLIKFIFIVSKLFEAKLIFSKPKKSQIVFFDRPGYTEIKKIIFKKKIAVLDAKLESINLYVVYLLIKSQRKINYHNYLITYIEICNPRFVIHNSVNPIFFHLKRDLLNVKFIFIQVGFIYQTFYKNFNLENCDYFFLWGQDKNLIPKKKKKVYFVGSLFNNRINKKKIRKYNNRILYISQFRKKKYFLSHTNKKIPIEIMTIADKILLKRLYKYSIENDFKIDVLGVSIKDSKDEIDFFKKYLSIKFKYIRKKSYTTSYSKALKYKIIVSNDSTLAWELLSKNMNVGIFFYRDKFVNKFGNKGFNIKGGSNFSPKDLSKKEFYRVMGNLQKNKNFSAPLDDDDLKLVNKHVIYDYKNKKLITNLNKILNEE
jgi:surface carbohydrate biosynthesis protein